LIQKRLLGIFASMAIVLAACGGATTSSAPAESVAPGESAAVESTAPESNLADEQILHTDIQGEPPTLDPSKAQDSNSIAVLYAITRPLVYVDKDLKVVPSLAESWEVSADAKTLTFHLRDAKYSNGDPIVAGDLVYSWKRLVDPRTAAPYSYVMAEVAGGEDLLALAGADPLPSDADIDALLDKLGVAAPDDKTFVVTLSTPASYFLSVATLWVTVPIQEKWITAPNATEAANYVASGPFVMDSWDHNSEIVLKPNPNWYGDVKPTLTEIHMSMSPEPAQAMAAYEAGEIETFLPVPNEDVQRVKDDPNLNPGYSEIAQLAITYYTFNNGNDPTGKKPLARCASSKSACPTANKNFRIALTEAIDKQAFIDATFSGLGTIANQMVMPGLPGFDESINPYPFNLDDAKAHMTTALSELGVSTAADLGKLKFGFNSGAGHEPRVAFLAEAWRQAFGLETDQIGSDFSVFLTQRTAGEYDLARDGWGADYPHANNQLNGLFTCGGGNNDDQYCNPAFDDLINQAAVESDQAKQADLYVQAQKILTDDAGFLPLRFGVTPQLVQPWVQLTSTALDSQAPGERFWEDIKILKH
jgi:oligopeptide transport system substrate-binding protein